VNTVVLQLWAWFSGLLQPPATPATTAEEQMERTDASGRSVLPSGEALYLLKV